MIREIADLNDEFGNPVIVVKQNVTHITPLSGKSSIIHFTSGQAKAVDGTVHELVSKIWLPNP